MNIYVLKHLSPRNWQFQMACVRHLLKNDVARFELVPKSNVDRSGPQRADEWTLIARTTAPLSHSQIAQLRHKLHPLCRYK